MRNLFMVLVMTLPTFAFADIRVNVAKGNVTYNGDVIKKGELLKKGGLLKTEKSSLVKVEFQKSGQLVVLGPNSIMELQYTDKAQKGLLKEGLLRYKTLKNGSPKAQIVTKQAAVAVRGTDYFLKANSLLGETEIILFEGLVQFKNRSQKNNNVNIKEGQWGGLGGRFGKIIQKPLNLPQNVLEVFKKQLPVD